MKAAEPIARMRFGKISESAACTRPKLKAEKNWMKTTPAKATVSDGKVPRDAADNARQRADHADDQLAIPSPGPLKPLCQEGARQRPQGPEEEAEGAEPLADARRAPMVNPDEQRRRPGLHRLGAQGHGGEPDDAGKERRPLPAELRPDFSQGAGRRCGASRIGEPMRLLDRQQKREERQAGEPPGRGRRSASSQARQTASGVPPLGQCVQQGAAQVQ